MEDEGEGEEKEEKEERIKFTFNSYKNFLKLPDIDLEVLSEETQSEGGQFKSYKYSVFPVFQYSGTSRQFYLFPFTKMLIKGFLQIIPSDVNKGHVLYAWDKNPNSGGFYNKLNVKRYNQDIKYKSPLFEEKKNVFNLLHTYHINATDYIKEFQNVDFPDLPIQNISFTFLQATHENINMMFLPLYSDDMKLIYSECVDYFLRKDDFEEIYGIQFLFFIVTEMVHYIYESNKREQTWNCKNGGYRITHRDQFNHTRKLFLIDHMRNPGQRKTIFSYESQYIRPTFLQSRRFSTNVNQQQQQCIFRTQDDTNQEMTEQLSSIMFQTPVSISSIKNNKNKIQERKQNYLSCIIRLKTPMARRRFKEQYIQKKRPFIKRKIRKRRLYFM